MVLLGTVVDVGGVTVAAGRTIEMVIPGLGADWVNAAAVGMLLDYVHTVCHLMVGISCRAPVGGWIVILLGDVPVSGAVPGLDGDMHTVGGPWGITEHL